MIREASLHFDVWALGDLYGEQVILDDRDVIIDIALKILVHACLLM